MLQVSRHPERFLPNPERVLARYRGFESERAKTLIQKVLALPEAEVKAAAEGILADFGSRHRHLEQTLRQHWQLAQHHAPQATELKPWQEIVLGAYFTMEYAIEAAAFFNPSLVPAPDQQGVPTGSQRVYFSFRAVGEGHISSVVFREALLDSHGHFQIAAADRQVDAPDQIRFPTHARSELLSQCAHLNVADSLTQALMNALPEAYTYAQLRQAVDEHRHHTSSAEQHHQLHQLLESVEDVYELQFSSDTTLSERVIFPVLEHERNGIEDARFVLFKDDDGQHTYYGTYTAYDGLRIQPRLLETTDFRSFRSFALNGPGAVNKNLALFPRRIKGRYAMLSRLDGVNNFIAFSEQLTQWENPQLLNTPEALWELGNSGNCGSPLETEAGWLVITHGVGPMRQYTLSAMLLDLDDPTQVIGCLTEPLLIPQADEREGYVPNVVYSCGSMLHNGRVLIPYGASDRFGAICSVELETLLAALT